MQQGETYDIIPDRAFLEGMNREFSFCPADENGASYLSKEQIALFNRDGFLAPLEVFTSTEAETHRTYFDALLASYLAEGKDSYSISTAHRRHAGVYDLLTDARIVHLVRDLLGPNIIGWGSHYFCKMAGDGKRVSWHQDAAYWPLTPSRTVTVWLAIDDADVENGCMRVAPGTHREGVHPFEESESNEQNVLNQTICYASDWHPPVDVELRAGQVSIHSDLLVHGSEPNLSNRRRCGLTLRYCSAEVVAELGWNRKGVVVAGEADPAMWPSATRPENA